MSCFQIAFTAPANPKGVNIRLSAQDLWQGCMLLAKAPELFTSAISTCEVRPVGLGRMMRTLKFTDTNTPALEQEVLLVENHKFECTTLGTGNRVTTVIFRGISEDPEDLYLSLEYSIPYGSADPDGADGERCREMYIQKGKQNLRDGLETMRRLKAEGKLN